ncbi:MAG: hypothetical protein ACI8UO_001692 [Verrucomicrobiales bacterium]
MRRLQNQRFVSPRIETMSLALENHVLPLEPDAQGVIRVRGTRVTLDTVVSAYLLGSTPEQIVEDYDTLDLADVYSVITFYLRHMEEVDRHLKEQRAEGMLQRQEIEARFSPQGVRERLLARRKEARGVSSALHS